MGRSQRLRNLKEVTTRLGRNKWKRAGQILHSVGMRGLLSRIRRKMQTGVDPAEEMERSRILTNESCMPRRGRADAFASEAMVSFSVRPASDNVAALEILTVGGTVNGMLTLEVFHDGNRLADACVPLQPGMQYTTVSFAPVFYPSDGRLTFVATVSGGGAIVTDRRRKSHDFDLAGGGRIFARIYASTDPTYELWMHCNDPSAEELARQAKHVFPSAPLFSVAVPLFNTPERYLREMIESVLAQSYCNWELCLADGSTDGRDRAAFAASYQDPRIRYRKLSSNEGIAGNSNRAIEMAQGDFVCLLDHDDTLAPHALYRNAAALEENPEYDFIYSDEDKLSDSGKRRFFPYFKPDYSPNLLRSFNYITHFSVFRRSLLQEIGLFREGFDGAQDYDLILRAADTARAVGHIPDVLYHWRTAPSSTASSAASKAYTAGAAIHALDDAVARSGPPRAKACETIQPNRFHIAYPLPEKAPPVSIVLPVQSSSEACASVDTLLSGTTYADLELLLPYDASDDSLVAACRELCSGDNRIHAVPTNSPHTTHLFNTAASQSHGDLLVLLDPCLTSVSDGWLEELAVQALRPEIGVVGGTACNANGTVRDAGYTLYACGIGGRAMHGLPCDHPGPLGLLFAVRDVAAVSSSCMMLRRALFETAAGFSDDFSGSLADIDLCLRIRDLGYTNLCVPQCRVGTAHSAAAADPDGNRDEEAVWLRKWLGKYPADPYGNPNLRCDSTLFETYPGPRGEALEGVLAAYTEV